MFICRMELTGHYMGLFHASPEFKSSVTLVNSPTGFPLASWDSQHCYVQFELFVSVVCSAPLAFVL